MEKAERKAEDIAGEESEEKKGLKRKLDVWEDQEEDDSKKDNGQIEEGKLKNAKKVRSHPFLSIIDMAIVCMFL